MTGALWLVGFLVAALIWVVWWLVADWRRDMRKCKAAGRTAQAAIADMGRHNVDASEERTDPKLKEILERLPVAEEPEKRPRRVPVGQILERVERQGYGVRLNWRREDEQRAKNGEGAINPGDFPTAVLPRIVE